MPERYERILRMVCVVLAAVLVFEIAEVFIKHSPVGRMSIPKLPELPPKTSAVAEVKATNGAPGKTNGKKGTNSTAEAMAGKKETNSAAGKAETNLTAAVKKKTTKAAAAESTKKETNAIVSTGPDKKGTNKISSHDFGKMGGGTNVVAGAMMVKGGTNKMAGTNATMGTNGMTNLAKGRGNFAPGMMAMNRHGGMGMFGMGGGEKLPDLPPLTQARIDKIIESEIMAPLTRAQPTALIGIAGDGAMLRSASGQSSYVKEGGQLGGIKLLSVGVNRVLVEEDGQKKELTIFSGIGGETLLPKQGETNEAIKKTP